MKRNTRIVCLILVICVFFAGCKSDDYKEAVALQEAGDYAAALEIYTTIDGYQDTSDRIAYCKSMISAIDAYDAATKSLSAKNDELNAAISAAEDLLASGKPALDPSLTPALEEAITNAQDAFVAITDMPADAAAIQEVASDMDEVDYSQVSEALADAESDLTQSIAKYGLVDAPEESYVMDCVARVPGVIAVAAATEETDTNNLLGKAGSYYARIVFSYELVGNSSAQGANLVAQGTDCGGSIEVFNTAEDAEKRSVYLGAFDGTIFASGSHTVIGTVLVRTSDKLTASQQKELEANIIEILTTVS